MATNKTRRTFSLAFKLGFLNAIATKQATVGHLLEKYDLSRSTFDRWRKHQAEGILRGDDSPSASLSEFSAGNNGHEAIDAEVEDVPNPRAVVVRNANGELERKLQQENEALLHQCEALRRERDLFRNAWLDAR